MFMSQNCYLIYEEPGKWDQFSRAEATPEMISMLRLLAKHSYYNNAQWYKWKYVHIKQK